MLPNGLRDSLLRMDALKALVLVFFAQKVQQVSGQRRYGVKHFRFGYKPTQLALHNPMAR